jgi:aryl-phospho-beta-D-glucosidase BglC (GH1 family)
MVRQASCPVRSNPQLELRAPCGLVHARRGITRAVKTAATIAVVVVTLLLPAAVPAADCPTDRFALWNIGVLRGANVFQGRNPGGGTNGIGDGDFTQTDFEDLAAAGANYVQISHAGLFGETPPYALDAVAQANLDQVVGMASAAGLYAVIAFRSGPGRNENAISNRDGTLYETVWTDQAAHDAWVAMLRYAAARYGDDPAVVGLSVMVEPNAYARHGFPDPPDFYLTYGGTLEDVNVLHAAAIAAIREVNTDVPVLLEPEGYGNITWLPYLTISADPHSVYTPHDYTPFDYTHQVVVGGTYPGDYDVDGQVRHVDQAFLASYLGSLQTFADQHGVPVALTEFGVHRTAPNAATFLTDRIGIQDTLGSWAVWTWQPAGFEDPFSMHDPSAAHDVLVAAWATNCRRGAGGNGGGGGEGGGGQGTISGRVRQLKRNGKPGKGLAKATVVAGGVSQRTRRRAPKGGYSLAVVAGTATVSASAGRKVCHVGATDGPRSLAVTITPGAVVTVDVFCGRR